MTTYHDDAWEESMERKLDECLEGDRPWPPQMARWDLRPPPKQHQHIRVVSVDDGGHGSPSFTMAMLRMMLVGVRACVRGTLCTLLNRLSASAEDDYKDEHAQLEQLECELAKERER